jgi:hypothetical protein
MILSNLVGEVKERPCRAAAGGFGGGNFSLLLPLPSWWVRAASECAVRSVKPSCMTEFTPSLGVLLPATEQSLQALPTPKLASTDEPSPVLDEAASKKMAQLLADTDLREMCALPPAPTHTPPQGVTVRVRSAAVASRRSKSKRSCLTRPRRLPRRDPSVRPSLQDSQRAPPAPRLRPWSRSRSARAWTPALGDARAGSQASSSTSTRTAHWPSTTTMATRRSGCCISTSAPRRARHPRRPACQTGRRRRRRACPTARPRGLQTRLPTAELGAARSSPRQPGRRRTVRLLAPQPLARRRLPRRPGRRRLRKERGPRASARQQRLPRSETARRTSGCSSCCRTKGWTKGKARHPPLAARCSPSRSKSARCAQRRHACPAVCGATCAPLTRRAPP